REVVSRRLPRVAEERREVGLGSVLPRERTDGLLEDGLAVRACTERNEQTLLIRHRGERVSDRALQKQDAFGVVGHYLEEELLPADTGRVNVVRDRRDLRDQVS